ncbi:MAG TPA: DUF2147 domain-containing protein [Flavobacterium sp.]|nr:DUF2147 domain-containing protein [Flavobacterium sp.]
MKKIILTFVFACVTLLNVQAQSVTGKWKTIDDQTGKPKSIVEITEKDGKIYGKVIEILTDKKEAKCDKCPGADKGKPVKGLTIIKGLKKTDKIMAIKY